MFIIPMSGNIHTIEAVDRAFAKNDEVTSADGEKGTGTFLDAMMGLWNDAAEAQAAKSEDMMNLMLGDTQSIESLQINIAKAELATELLVNVKNAVVDAYNEIMRMSV